MSEYNIGFSKKLIGAARFVAGDGLDSENAIRTVLYLSKLACEITLKALHEKAGRPVVEIRNYGHDLSKLLVEFGKCKVLERGLRGGHGPKGAAKILGLHPSTLRFRMKKLGILKQTNFFKGSPW